MNKTGLKIYPDKIESTIPRYLFGHFLEYMNDCIDPGLWAELLISRGFEYPDSEENGVSLPWRSVGSHVKCSIDKDHVYAPKQSQCICNKSAGYGGIEQTGLRFEESTTYQGYIWAYCEKIVNLYIRLLSDTEIIFEKSYILQKDVWKKCEFSFENIPERKNVTVQYMICGSGTVWLDQGSLKPGGIAAGTWPSVMKLIRGLSPAIMRFPGGCAADCYFWTEGIGDRDKRPSRENIHWGGIEQNQFGTDDYLAFCREIHSEPLICVNFGSSTPEDAANWVEYCNGTTDTPYGALRAENGHPEPYNVKYWEIGNEVYGDWEIGHLDAVRYADKYLDFAHAMKEKDPDIKLLACGGDAGNYDQAWNRVVLGKLKGEMDMLTLHFYAPQIASQLHDPKKIFESIAAFSRKAEKVLELTEQTMLKEQHVIPLAITEWNCNFGEADNNDYEQTQAAVVANASLLNMFFRKGNRIFMCNVSDLINGWGGGIIRSDRGRAFGTGTYHLMKIYEQTRPQNVVACEYECATYNISEFGNIESQKNVPYLDIVCCKGGDQQVIAYVVNRHYKESVELNIEGWMIWKVKQIWAEDTSTKNSFKNPELLKPEEYFYNKSEIKVLPHSVMLLWLREG